MLDQITVYFAGKNVAMLVRCGERLSVTRLSEFNNFQEFTKNFVDSNYKTNVCETILKM